MHVILEYCYNGEIWQFNNVETFIKLSCQFAINVYVQWSHRSFGYWYDLTTGVFVATGVGKL